MDDFWDMTLRDLLANIMGIVFGITIVFALFYLVFRYEDIWEWFKSLFR